jgi:hypothetical protein
MINIFMLDFIDEEDLDDDESIEDDYNAGANKVAGNENLQGENGQALRPALVCSEISHADSGKLGVRSSRRHHLSSENSNGNDRRPSISLNQVSPRQTMRASLSKRLLSKLKRATLSGRLKTSGSPEEQTEGIELAADEEDEYDLL